MREFDLSLPMRLLKAREVVMRKFMPTLRSHGLSAQQWRVLRALMEAEQRDASEISGRCAILMSSLSRILRNLHRRGLISRKICAGDQRRSLISITAQGRSLVNEIAPISEQRYDHIARKFGSENLSNLYSLLSELIDSLEDDEATDGR